MLHVEGVWHVLFMLFCLLSNRNRPDGIGASDFIRDACAINHLCADVPWMLEHCRVFSDCLLTAATTKTT